MKRRILPLILILLLSLFLASTALAADPGCPPGFELHDFMDHEEHHEGHIGVAEDLNGDGLICVKHLPGGLHVHVDNLLPSPE